jgi:hypothetical protein
MEFESLDPSGKGGDTPIIDLEFVSMNAASETEKQRNKQIIRSAAMKSFHRKQQLQRGLDGTVHRGSYSKAQRCSLSSGGNVSPSSSSRGSSNRLGPDGSSSRQPLVISSPTSLLGAGRVDPFRIQPVDIGSRVNELLDHCKFLVLERLAVLSN